MPQTDQHASSRPPDGPKAAEGRSAEWLAAHPRWRRTALGLTDLMLLVLAFGLAYEIRFDFQAEGFTDDYRLQFLCVMPWLVLIRLIALQALGLYQGFTRYTGLHELTNIVLACFIGTAGLVLFNLVTHFVPSLGGYPVLGEHILRAPRGVVVIDALLAIALVAGVRLGRRYAAERLGLAREGARRRVLILGAGDAGEQVARDLLRHHRARYQPVAFADPNPDLIGRRIHGLPVAGGLRDLERLTLKHRVEEIVIALPRPEPAIMRQIVEHCRRARLEFKLIPDVDAVISGRVQISQLRPVEIEDLLGRSPVVLGTSPERSCLTGRRVLVTGAGGSIGAELCRQTLEHRAAALTLLGRGENSLYDIHEELRPRAQELGIELRLVVGDVRDPSLVQPLFKHVRPQVVLHAAAHKHVHLMELQPAEAVKNNVTGTRVTAQAAQAVGAERFILISTDKAVRPTGVMGASKRVAEMTVAALDAKGPTTFIAVRFGNVLGSRGSVIPLFRRQIAAGGPVTVTDPEVSRYFMTISEAVSLVIEAGSQGKEGEVFLLDMGQPIKIADLARNLITLSGLEPDRDITIEFTGMRPGEKLHEQLVTDQSDITPTDHEKIYHCAPDAVPWGELAAQIARMEKLAAQGDEEGIVKAFKELIADYQPASAEERARARVSGKSNPQGMIGRG